ncbi:DUF551 domain-containing protein [Enterobacter hormaechei]
MSELTKEWLLKTIAELEEERDATPGAVNDDAAMALAAMKIALASLEAEKIAEPVAKVETVGVCWYADNGVPRKPAVGTELYAAPPAPVVPDAYIRDGRGRMMLNGRQEPRIGYSAGWNACRAAMLRGAEPVTTANKLPLEQWLSQQTGNIDVECGCVMTEVFFHWLRVAYEAGNSPMIPDGWVACSERIPEAMVSVLVTGTWFHHAVAFWDGLSWCDLDFEQPVTHWMPLPAAPQQEVK